jgi:hypothetical protein
MSYVLEITVVKDPRDTSGFTDPPIYQIMSQTPERWMTLNGNALPATTRGARVIDIVIAKHLLKARIEFTSRRQATAWLVQYEFNAGEWLPVKELEYLESRRVIGYEWDGQNPIGRCVDYKTLESKSSSNYRLLYDERVDAR